MKAAVMKEGGGLEVQDVPEPGEPGPDRVKGKIAYCGICGSELHSLDPDYTSRPSQFKRPPGGASMAPGIGGHEASGTGVAVGENVQGSAVGDRVGMNFRSPCGTCYYCRNKMEHFCERVIPATGAYAEYAMYHANAIYKLPDDVSLEVGALLEPVTVAVHTVDIAEIYPGCTLAIMGGGPIGMLVLEVAKIAGAAKILVSEPVESRRKLAEKLGATVTVNPLKEHLVEFSMKLTEGRGFDRVIDASGKLAVAKQCIELPGKLATVVWAAMYPVGAEG